MKSLPNVTLISYDNTNEPVRTLRVLQQLRVDQSSVCSRRLSFAASFLKA